MNKKKIIMITLIVAAMAMMWTKLAPWFLPRRGRARVAAVVPAVAVPAAVLAVAPNVAVPAALPAQKIPEGNLVRLRREFGLDLWSRTDVYDRELKNPFIMRILAEEALLDILALDISIEGIIWAVDNPLVIINGKIYNIGDVIMYGLWIKEIKFDHIIITDGKKERSFILNKGDSF